MDITKLSATKLVQLLAFFFLTLVSIACVIIFVIDTLNGTPVPTAVSTFMGTGIGYALHALGIEAAATVNGNGHSNGNGQSKAPAPSGDKGVAA